MKTNDFIPVLPMSAQEIARRSAELEVFANWKRPQTKNFRDALNERLLQARASCQSRFVEVPVSYNGNFRKITALLNSRG